MGKMLKDKKAMREGFKARIQYLTKLLEESQALTSHERHFKKEVKRSLESIPASWRKIMKI